MLFWFFDGVIILCYHHGNPNQNGKLTCHYIKNMYHKCTYSLQLRGGPTKNQSKIKKLIMFFS